MLYAFIVAAIVTLLGGADIAAVSHIEHQAAEFQQNGGSTLIYRLKSAIDGAACDGLSLLPGVNASGAVRQRGTGLTPAALPTQQVPTFDVSPGFSNFAALGRPRGGSGLVISEDAAHTLGAAKGQLLRFRDGEARVAAVFTYPSDGRQPGYGYSILAPTDTRTPFDECWVEAWPAADELLSVLPTVVLPGAESGPDNPGAQLLQLNASHGTHFEGESLFGERLTRFAPLVAAVCGLALGAAATTRRRLELAAARHAGVRTATHILQLNVETLVWAIGGCVVALPLLTAVIAAQPEPNPSIAAWLTSRTMLAIVPAALMGATVATLRIKERHLFRYFKAR